jgi:hypothetical protein
LGGDVGSNATSWLAFQKGTLPLLSPSGRSLGNAWSVAPLVPDVLALAPLGGGVRHSDHSTQTFQSYRRARGARRGRRDIRWRSRDNISSESERFSPARPKKGLIVSGSAISAISAVKNPGSRTARAQRRQDDHDLHPCPGILGQPLFTALGVYTDALSEIGPYSETI